MWSLILYVVCMCISVHSKDYQLGPIRQNLNYFRGSLSQNFQFLLKIGWFTKKKASFLHIVTKSVEPIFQGLEPIVRRRALKGTLMCMYVVICKIDHCIHIHWCIPMGLGHNDLWVESRMWPQQTWGQRSSRGQWPLVQVFGKKGQCIHILWCIFKSNITMIAKVCDRESRRDSWFENRLVFFIALACPFLFLRSWASVW